MPALTEIYRDDGKFQDESLKEYSSEQLTQWKETGVIDDFQGEILDLSNQKGWLKNSLIIQNCPQLKIINAEHCELRNIKLTSIPFLNGLYLNDNNLSWIPFLKNLTSLEHLRVSNNEIEELDGVNELTNLKSLWCFKNNLVELDCQGLTKLEDLNFHDNAGLDFDSVRTYCFKKFNIEGCENLKILDAAENEIENLILPYLPSLESLSLRENCFSDGNVKRTKVLTLNVPNLKDLDYAYSNIKEVKHLCPTPYLKSVVNTPWKKEYKGLKKNQYYKENPKFEQKAYEYRIEQQKKDFEEGRGLWAGTTHMDLSNMSYLGHILIDGNQSYPKSLTHINLGDNYWETITVKNLPNLKQLIISHNKIKHLKIENCPNLDQSKFYTYLSDDQSRITPADAKEYNEEENNPFKQEERLTNLTQQIKDILVNPDNYSWQDLVEIFKDDSLLSQIDSELFDQLKTLYRQKLEQANPELYKEIKAYQQIPPLLNKAKITFKAGNYEELEKIIEQILQYKDTKIYFNNYKEEVDKLTKQLEQMTNSTQQPTPDYLPLITIVSLFLTFWVGFYLFLKKNEFKG